MRQCCVRSLRGVCARRDSLVVFKSGSDGEHAFICLGPRRGSVGVPCRTEARANASAKEYCKSSASYVGQLHWGMRASEGTGA
eukprot:9836096-Alexandrium_andersonii.AAC.1